MGGVSIRCKLRRNNNDTGRTDTSSADSAAGGHWDIWIGVTGDMEEGEMNLTKTQLKGLNDMRLGHPYYWKPKTMAVLASLGLVVECVDSNSQRFYMLTPEGVKAKVDAQKGQLK